MYYENKKKEWSGWTGNMDRQTQYLRNKKKTPSFLLEGLQWWYYELLKLWWMKNETWILEPQNWA